MRRFILDTNILMAFVRGNTLFQTANTRCQLLDNDAQLFISVVSFAEIQVLAKRNAWGDAKLKKLAAFIDVAILLDIFTQDTALMQAYVDIDIYSNSMGRKMGKNDLWIAATAKVTNASLVITDGDFDHLSVSMLKLEKIN